ncbi:hypothetical protein BC832DRAFT_71627 [Gaertneriomyces semiglobifer]|nr:hypothetical protein BC832DRAFT_71627 [Gaertneriomyces semiglobifer]
MASVRNFTRFGRKIIAIGRNFAEHAKELNNPVPTKPMFFLKPTSSYITQGAQIEIPKGCEVHHELELGVVIGRNGRDIKARDADSYIGGYFLALDMTARNLQNEAKKSGHPWSMSKGFDTFTPVSDFIEKSAIPDPHNVDLWLKIGDKTVQSGNTSDMIFSVPSLVEYISSVMKLEEGDVILTGTPSGVGPVAPGQILTGGLKVTGRDEDVVKFSFPVINRQGTGLFSVQ